MADSQSPDPDGCFHCPQGDKPCPVTYQPGAWLAQLPAEPTAAVPDRPHVLTSSTPASSRPSANCTKPWPATPDDLAGLPADMKRAWVVVGGAGWRRYDLEGCCRPNLELR
jgi:hypothetical protein